jgi:glyoxylase-like metal-dependent hydrolase (beta-lactamase superfamily II)
LVLVDTGPGDPETWGRQVHYFYDRTPDQVLVTALSKLGIEPKDIDVVINTHLHWQNCHGNHLFPRATIHIQTEEVEEALNPVEPHYRFYTPPEMKPPWLQVLDRTRLVRGDSEIVDGLTVLSMPSHTQGFQSVLVDSREGPILIAGEMIPYSNNWTGRWGMQHVPSGIMQASLRQYYSCFERIKEISPVYILPGLDPAVAELETYG